MGLRDRPGILVGAVARACLLHLERQGRGEEVASVLAPLLDHEFVEREFPTRGGVPLDDETLSSISFRFDPYHHPDPDRHRHTTPPPVLTVSASVARGIVIGDIMLWIGNGALPKTVVTDLFARAENGTLVLGDVVRTGDPTLDPLPLRFPRHQTPLGQGHQQHAVQDDTDADAPRGRRRGDGKDRRMNDTDNRTSDGVRFQVPSSLERRPLLIGAVARSCLLASADHVRGADNVHGSIARDIVNRLGLLADEAFGVLPLTLRRSRTDPDTGSFEAELRIVNGAGPGGEDVLRATCDPAPGIELGDVTLTVRTDGFPASAIQSLKARSLQQALTVGDIIATGMPGIDGLGISKPFDSPPTNQLFPDATTFIVTPSDVPIRDFVDDLLVRTMPLPAEARDATPRGAGPRYARDPS